MLRYGRDGLFKFPELDNINKDWISSHRVLLKVDPSNYHTTYYETAKSSARKRKKCLAIDNGDDSSEADDMAGDEDNQIVTATAHYIPSQVPYNKPEVSGKRLKDKMLNKKRSKAITQLLDASGVVISYDYVTSHLRGLR